MLKSIGVRALATPINEKKLLIVFQKFRANFFIYKIIMILRKIKKILKR
jgi:hypothetical protein